jgi:hypothetical protein
MFCLLAVGCAYGFFSELNVAVLRHDVLDGRSARNTWQGTGSHNRLRLGRWTRSSDCVEWRTPWTPDLRTRQIRVTYQTLFASHFIQYAPIKRCTAQIDPCLHTRPTINSPGNSTISPRADHGPIRLPCCPRTISLPLPSVLRVRCAAQVPGFRALEKECGVESEAGSYEICLR